MKTRTNGIWSPNASGVLVPIGSIVEGEENSRTTIHHIKDHALAIEKVFAKHGVSIPNSGELQQMLNKVKAMSDARLTNQIERFSGVDFFDALHVARMAEAILPLNSISGATPYLRRLVSGSLNFFNRRSSSAKDVFWELELFALLRRRNSNAQLQDPPDLVVDLEGGRVGIACKKLYSEGNVEKVLSEAVSQVAKGFEVAVVAINIDDLLPEQQIYSAKTGAQLTAAIRGVVDEFIKRHERHFKKYLSTQRLVGAVVTCNLVADIAEWKVNLINARQSTVWCFPGLDAAASRRIRALEGLLIER